MLFLSTDDKQTKLNFGKVTTKKTVPAESFTISDSEDEAADKGELPTSYNLRVSKLKCLKLATVHVIW